MPHSIHPAEAGLPTISKLGISSKSSLGSIDPIPIAQAWIQSFTKAASQQTLDIPSLVSDILLPSTFQSTILNPDSDLVPGTHLPPTPKTGDKEAAAYWRDALALTWDFRTFEGTAKIQKFLQDRLAGANIKNVTLQLDEAPPVAVNAFADTLWIQIFFKFETDVGGCTGIAKLVPVASPNEQPIKWKAQSIFTRLESLHGVPELLGQFRKDTPYHGPWDELRAEETAYKEKEPTVLIVGGGQSGLMVAANLKVLGVDSLVIERSERIGDCWRKRYEALCLHDPVWYDHMSFLPFPKTWPVYTPAQKLANWLESYVDSLDLNAWTSSTVTKAVPGAGGKGWAVTVVSKRKGPGNSEEEKTRVFQVKHVVFATGFNGGLPNVPEIPGKDKFKGEVIHSSQHNKGTDHTGKRVLVVGACTSAFDISVDYADHGIDVTMYQRKSSYIISAKGVRALLGGLYSEAQPHSTEMSDRINLANPTLGMAGVYYRARTAMAELDQEIIQGLESKGFHVNTGYRDTGLIFLVFITGGGYYLDVGGSQYIIDGRIKVKGDCGSIKEFTETGLKFDDGSEVEADVVVFCTGITGANKSLSNVLDQEIVDKVGPIWGLNEEGEIRGCYREIGPRGLWSMMGNLAMCRIHSKHVALQIKAIEDGVFGERYSA